MPTFRHAVPCFGLCFAIPRPRIYKNFTIYLHSCDIVVVNYYQNLDETSSRKANPKRQTPSDRGAFRVFGIPTESRGKTTGLIY